MAVATLALTGVAMAETVTERLDVEQPRGFGYVLGDKFTRVVHLDLRHPYRLESDKLPVAGRATAWLTLEAPRVAMERDGDATRYRIEFTYQILNVNAEFNDIAVPSHTLVFGNGAETLQALVPATRVLVSPLDLGEPGTLQPAHAPQIQPEHRERAMVAAVLLLCALAGLACAHWGWPSFSTARPFRAAWRQAKGLGNANDARYRAVLLAVHRAFNSTAGRTVFAETLDVFFADHHRFLGARDPIERYFAHSRQYFYGSGGDPGADAYTADDLKGLLRRLADIERGLG